MDERRRRDGVGLGAMAARARGEIEVTHFSHTLGGGVSSLTGRKEVREAVCRGYALYPGVLEPRLQRGQERQRGREGREKERERERERNKKDKK